MKNFCFFFREQILNLLTQESWVSRPEISFLLHFQKTKKCQQKFPWDVFVNKNREGLYIRKRTGNMIKRILIDERIFANFGKTILVKVNNSEIWVLCEEFFWQGGELIAAEVNPRQSRQPPQNRGRHRAQPVVAQNQLRQKPVTLTKVTQQTLPWAHSSSRGYDLNNPVFNPKFL